MNGFYVRMKSFAIKADECISAGLLTMHSFPDLVQASAWTFETGTYWFRAQGSSSRIKVCFKIPSFGEPDRLRTEGASSGGL